MKIFSIFTGVAFLALTLLISAFDVEICDLFRPAILLAAQVPKSPTGGQPTKQPKTKTDDSAKKKAAAAEYAVGRLQRCRSILADEKDGRISTYQTNIEQHVRIGGREFHAKGMYYKGTDRKFRLELAMEFGSKKTPTKARLLQVCDGEILMTEQVIGKRKRYTRRNVKQILAAAAGAVRMPQQQVLSELGLGGLIALIASLEQTIEFDTRKFISTKTVRAVQIEGGWKPAYDFSQGGKRPMPEHIPDRVRVLIDADDLLRKIEYLKRDPKSKSLASMVTLQFHRIQLNPKLDQKLFRYVAKPGVFVEDTTQSYIQLFRQPAKKKK